MDAIQVMGKRVSAAKVADLFAMMAAELKSLDTIQGSLEHDKYCTQVSFNLNGTIVGFSMLDMEGGKQ